MHIFFSCWICFQPFFILHTSSFNHLHPHLSFAFLNFRLYLFLTMNLYWFRAIDFTIYCNSNFFDTKEEPYFIILLYQKAFLNHQIAKRLWMLADLKPWSSQEEAPIKSTPKPPLSFINHLLDRMIFWSQQLLAKTTVKWNWDLSSDKHRESVLDWPIIKALNLISNDTQTKVGDSSSTCGEPDNL